MIVVVAVAIVVVVVIYDSNSSSSVYICMGLTLRVNTVCFFPQRPVYYGWKKTSAIPTCPSGLNQELERTTDLS